MTALFFAAVTLTVGMAVLNLILGVAATLTGKLLKQVVAGGF